MGFFSGYNNLEQELLEQYTAMLAPLGIDSNGVKEMLDDCIKSSKNEGTYNLPNNFGDTLLQKERTDNNTKKNFEQKRAEGVRDEDIRWWFNLNDVERKMMLKVDELHRMVLFIQNLEDGKTEEEAASEVRKYYPTYGDLNDETHGKGDDKPLPFELKNRINIYIERQGAGNSEFKKEVESYSTFNALVRAEIKKGNI